MITKLKKRIDQSVTLHHDMTNIPLGDVFPNGLLVKQDGSGDDYDKPALQKFKLVCWD